jgi:TetR/AcrR family transcriptional regulator
MTSKRKETIGREQDQRGEQTRTKLLVAAIECFATQGYDATGTRLIESKAGVKRGLIAWHFQSKETLWKAAAVSLFSRAAEDFAAVRMQLSDVSQTQQLRQMVKVYVRFLAKYPQIHRLLSTEGSHESWRLTWLVENIAAPWYADLQRVFVESKDAGMFPDMDFIHFFYILTGSAAMIFAMAPEARCLSGKDVLQPEFVEAHADALIALIFK